MISLEKAKQRAFDSCNLEGGESVDIYKYLYRYKAIRDLPDEEIEKIYDEMAAGLGFLRKD